MTLFITLFTCRLQEEINTSLCLRLVILEDTSKIKGLFDFISSPPPHLWSKKGLALWILTDGYFEMLVYRLLVLKSYSLLQHLISQIHALSCSKQSKLSLGNKVNMADEAKFCSLICSTFEGLVVRQTIGCCHEELGPFCWPNADCRYCSFQSISSVYWAYFSDVMVLPELRKL